MTIKELHIRLQELNVPEERYFLHGLYGSTEDEGRLSMIIKKGKYTIEYEVYFRERGEKHSIIIFTNETEACEYMLKRIVESDKYYSKISEK